MNKNKIEIEDIVEGQSYACYFRVNTMLDNAGNPARGNIGESFPGPGDYNGFGIIKTRDTDKELLKIIDLDLDREFVVSFKNVWGVDTVEIANE